MARTRKRKTEEKDGVTKKMKMSKKTNKRKRESKKETKTRKRSKKVDQKKSGKSKLKNRVATPRPEPVEIPRLPPYEVEKNEAEEVTTIKSYPKKKTKRSSLNQKVTFSQENPLVLPDMDHTLLSNTLSTQNNVRNDETQEKEMEPQTEDSDGLGVLFMSIWIAFVSQLLTLYDFEDYERIIVEYFGHPACFLTLVNLALYSVIFAITKPLFVDVSRQICCIRCLQAFCFVFPSAVLNFYPASSALFHHTSQRLACMFFGYIVAEQLYSIVVCPSNQETSFSMFKNILLLASFVFVEMQISFEAMITFAMFVGIQMNVIHIILFAVYHLEWSFEFEIASMIAVFISSFGSAIPPVFYDNMWNSFLENVFDKEFILNIINLENRVSHF